MFSRDDNTGWNQSKLFKKTFSIDVEIEFVGVWYVTMFPFQRDSDTELGNLPYCVTYRDTVCSVGIVSRTLPFTASNTSIRHFRHAISLDEHRAKFQASYYLRPEKHQKGTEVGEMPRSNQRHLFYRRMLPHHRNKSKSKMQYAKEYDDGRTVTDAMEVWFAGCHGGNFLLVLT